MPAPESRSTPAASMSNALVVTALRISLNVIEEGPPLAWSISAAIATA